MSRRLLGEAVDRLATLHQALDRVVGELSSSMDRRLARLTEVSVVPAIQAVRPSLQRALSDAHLSIGTVLGTEIMMLNLRLGRHTPTPAPPQQPLEHELLNGRIGSVLLLHDTDRWHFGDFIRHASWVTSLAETGAVVDLASNPGYLPLFGTDGRVRRLINSSQITNADLARYDLVVVPGAERPTTFSPAIARGIYTYDDGWMYTRYGSNIAGAPRDEVNYFRAALHQQGQTALPTARPATLRLPEDDVLEIGAAVRSVFGNDRPVVVYNPTASNPRTRQTMIPTEAENVISGPEHVTMLRAMRDLMPTHNILIASALAPGDGLNVARIRSLSRTFAADPGVKTVFDLRRPELTSLRGFSMLLASDAVVASTGTSTGTNTHLASMVGLPSFSVERAADAEIQANWARQGVLPMSPIRWRNPSPLAGAVKVDGLQKAPAEFERAAAAFALHLGVQTEGVGPAVIDVTVARQRARDLQAVMGSAPPRIVLSSVVQLRASLRPEAQALYGDFSDELAVLRAERPDFAAVHSLDDLLALPNSVLELDARLIQDVVKDSMLHKVAQVLAPLGDDELPAYRRTKAASSEALLRKLRAHAPLTTAELDLLRVGSVGELADHLRERLDPHVRNRIEVAAMHGNTFQVGWQHEVTVNEGSVVKTLSTNEASEYLTDDYTVTAIRAALDAGGGLIPASLLVDDHTTVSRRLRMLVEPGGKTVAPELGGGAVAETVLPVGWVDEQLDGYLRLGDQGIFNFDIKFKDIGIDDGGVLQVADFSVVARIDQHEQWPPPNLRTDVFHMGVNELIRNGQYLREFANGEQLQEHYVGLVEGRIGIDLRPHLQSWHWGDHGDSAITPLAAQLRDVFLSRARAAQPRPVFPLVDYRSEGIAFDYIAEQLLESRT